MRLLGEERLLTAKQSDQLEELDLLKKGMDGGQAEAHEKATELAEKHRSELVEARKRVEELE